jgi:hypothetical protein
MKRIERRQNSVVDTMPAAVGQVKIRHKAARSSLFIPFFTCPPSTVTVLGRGNEKSLKSFSQLFENLNS